MFGVFQSPASIQTTRRIYWKEAQMSVSLTGIKMSGLRMKNSFVVLFKRSIEIQSLTKCYGNEFTILQHPSQKSDFLSFLLSPLSIDSIKCFFFSQSY